MASDRENQAPSKVNTPVLPHLRVPPTLSTFSVSPEAMADDTHKQLEEYRQKYEKEKLSTGELRKDIKDLEMALENEREVQQKGQNSNIEAEKEANYRSYEQARVKCEALQREKASLEARVKSSEYQREQQENNYKQLAAEYASVKEKFAAEKHKNDSQKVRLLCISRSTLFISIVDHASPYLIHPKTRVSSASKSFKDTC